MQFIPVNYYENMPNTDGRAWEGVWVGVSLETDEHLIGTEHGIYTSRTVRRKPANERWSSTAVRGVKGLPWKPIPEKADDTLVPKVIPTEQQHPETQPAEDPKLPPRRFRIERKHLEQYRYTSACPGCYAQRHSRPNREHTQHRRERIRRCILEDPAAKHIIRDAETWKIVGWKTN